MSENLVKAGKMVLSDIFCPAIKEAILSNTELYQLFDKMRFFNDKSLFEARNLDPKKIYAQLCIQGNTCFLAILLSEEVANLINEELIIRISKDVTYFLEDCSDLLKFGEMMLEDFKNEYPTLFIEGPIFQSGMDCYIPSFDIMPSEV